MSIAVKPRNLVPTKLNDFMVGNSLHVCLQTTVPGRLVDEGVQVHTHRDQHVHERQPDKHT